MSLQKAPGGDLLPEALADPATQALAKKVKCFADPDTAFPTYFSGGLEVSLADGREWLEATWGELPGQPGLDALGILTAAAEGKLQGLVLLGADPLADFIHKNPTVVMLALGFLLMIGAVLIADGFGVHVPKGYIYAAMAFSAGVEALNMLVRKAAHRKVASGPVHDYHQP